MERTNPVFKQNYNGYMKQLQLSDVLSRLPVLGITTDKNGQTIQVPFFNAIYQVSKSGVRDNRGKRPDYGICIILLKYLLMCPKQVAAGKEWIPFRDFKDAGRGQNTDLSDHAVKKISEFFSGRLNHLKKAVKRLGSMPPDNNYPYDFCTVIHALPQIPLLFLFNDADEQFPARASILYERRAEYFLDAECRVMVDWCLLEHLKKIKNEK
jgi:hypothetical protein